jgi:hypothetical protein
MQNVNGKWWVGRLGGFLGLSAGHFRGTRSHTVRLPPTVSIQAAADTKLPHPARVIVAASDPRVREGPNKCIDEKAFR